MYGIHTFRVESIAHGKAAAVDEIQVQGVANPGLLRKVKKMYLLTFIFLYFNQEWTEMTVVAHTMSAFVFPIMCNNN